jgi:hypothetical protein
MKPENRKYYSIMASARTKILSSVSLPAFLGAAFAYTQDYFSFTRFSLFFIGLIFSDLLYLLTYDYKVLKPENYKKWFILPGNPVFNTMSLPRKKIPQMLGVSFVGWGIVLLFFMTQVGSFIAYMMVAILILSMLRVFDNLIAISFLSALLTPFISFAVFFALSGEEDLSAFIIGIPLVWISLSIIISHFGLYSSKVNFIGRYFLPIVLLKFISFINIIYFVSEEIYSSIALLSIIIYILGFMKLMKLNKAGSEDNIPFISVEYMIYVSVMLLIIVSVFLI